MCSKEIIQNTETSEGVNCVFFNTYRLHRDGEYAGQICSMYSETWPHTYGTNAGQVRESGSYTISDSYIASNATNPRPVPSGEACGDHE